MRGKGKKAWHFERDAKVEIEQKVEEKAVPNYSVSGTGEKERKKELSIWGPNVLGALRSGSSGLMGLADLLRYKCINVDRTNVSRSVQLEET